MLPCRGGDFEVDGCGDVAVKVGRHVETDALEIGTPLLAEPSSSGCHANAVPLRQTTCGGGGIKVGHLVEAVPSRQAAYGGMAIEVGRPAEEASSM